MRKHRGRVPKREATHADIIAQGTGILTAKTGRAAQACIQGHLQCDGSQQSGLPCWSPDEGGLAGCSRSLV